MTNKLFALNDDTQQLISILHRGGNYSFFQRINGDDKCSYWRRYGKIIEFPVDVVEKYNLFFGVNPATVKITDDDRKKYPKISDDAIATFVGTKNSTIAALNCLYAEFDGKDYTFPSDEEIERIFQTLRVNPDKANANDATLRLEAAGAAKEAKYATNPTYYKSLAWEHVQGLKPEPSVVVDSAGGFQGYWLATETFVINNEADRERAISLQKRWVSFVCGDLSVHDIRRILRVPGSRNWKKRYAPEHPIITFVKKDFDLRYSFEELEALLPLEEPKPTPTATNGTYYTNGDGRESFINMFNANNRIADVLLAHGYTWISKDRMNRPGSEDSKGVVIYAEENESYHHSGGDPLHNGYRIKPFNVVCKLDYNDDPKAAIKALKPPSESYASQAPQTGSSETPSLSQWEVAPTDEPEKRNTWPYLIRDGMLIFQKEKVTRHGSEIIDTEICAFTAKISEEIIMEDGRKIFVIEGVGKRGGPFKFEIDAELYGTTNKLCAALESAVGSKDPIFAEQHKHVGPAIKILTDNIQPVRRYVRTGWTPHGFVIPGKVIPGVDIQLDRKLAYEYDTKADLEKGKYALGRLIESIHPGNACIVLSAIFTAPLAQLIGWENERYGIFNKGITNSLKTSWTQAAMCIYGKGFINRDNLIKFGDGSTKTALMTYATKAGHMPYSLDNYKPNTGGGAKEFISMLHNIMEGGDRDRGKRDGGIRENHSITCWPIFTGEDMPDSDASSFARVLVVPFAWGKNELNKALGEAQALSEHLPAIGRTWLDYLSNEETKAIIIKTKERYWATREAWIKYLADQHEDMSITLRIATSLTINQLAFEIVCQCFEMLTQYKDVHIEALRSVAGGMAIHTTESAEYQRFLAALKELLATGRAIVIPRKGYPSDTRIDPDRFMGWIDDEGYYLLPAVARRLVMSVLDKDGLNGISNQQLYDQLQQAGMMISDAKQSTRLIKVAGNSARVLHLRPHALQEKNEATLYEELGI